MAENKMETLRLGWADNELLDYQYLRALSYQLYGGASTGEVLRVASRIRESGNSRQSWVDAWKEQGQASHQLGEQALISGHPVTARSFFLRAYNYLRAAEFYFDRRRDGALAHRDLYRQSVASFDAALPLLDRPAEKVSIPYLNGVFIPGYFFKTSVGSEPLPTVIICGGGDSFGEESYFTAGVPEALARGLNVLVFHGPGQRGMLHEHPELVFRPDYELPIGKVIDYAISRSDVDGQFLGLYGYSFGGYLAPRAASFDTRIKALAANAPLRNPQDLIMGLLLAQTSRAQHPLTDQQMGLFLEQAMQRDWVIAGLLEQQMFWTSGTSSVADYLDNLRNYTLEGLEPQISCPTLCVIPEGEGAAALEQARQVYDALTCPKTFISLPEAVGADNHVGMNNITFTAGIVFDWFYEVFFTHGKETK